MGSVRWQEILPQIRLKFREQFVFPHKKVTQWFPGHMNRGEQKLAKNSVYFLNQIFLLHRYETDGNKIKSC